jgi:hypothetical protein
MGKMAQKWSNIDSVWLMRKQKYPYNSMDNSHLTVV